MKCTECQGKGFIEYEHGLVMVKCEVCNGNKTMPDDISTEEEGAYLFGEPDVSQETPMELGRIFVGPDGLDFAYRDDVSTEDAEIEKMCCATNSNYIPPEEVESIITPEELKGFSDDITSGTGQPDKPTGSRNTRKPRGPNKPKANSKTAKRTRKVLQKT